MQFKKNTRVYTADEQQGGVIDWVVLNTQSSLPNVFASI